MSQAIDRRGFLFGASVAGFGVLRQGRNGWAGGVGPNDVIQVACVGVGGKGRSDTDNAANHGRIVALCDVDEKRLDAAAAKYKEAKRFVDFRELYDALGSKFDAVTVSTPDHTHAPAAVRDTSSISGTAFFRKRRSSTCRRWRGTFTSTPRAEPGRSAERRRSCGVGVALRGRTGPAALLSSSARVTQADRS